MGRVASPTARTRPPCTRNPGAAPALNSRAVPVYKSTLMRSSVAPLSSSLFSASATFTSRAASSAVKPALSSRAVSSAARLPSTAAGRPVPMPSHKIICAAVGLQNCCTASPDTSPRAAALAAPNTARSAGLSLNSRVVIPLQESTCGTSSVRRQICPTSPASAASSCGVNRVRGSVTAAWVRPRSSSVTAHSCGGAPSPVKNSATRLDL